MAKCVHCHANLPHGVIRCSYCGAANDIDLEGKHYYTVHPCEDPRICPLCKTPMACLNLGNTIKPFFIERCEHCFGLFFDPGELDLLVRDHSQGVFNIDALRLDTLRQENAQNNAPVSYRACPVCQKLMNRQNYGNRSGVVIDRCRDHGVFLDGGELKRILLWARLGGVLQSEQIQAEQKKPAPVNPKDWNNDSTWSHADSPTLSAFDEIRNILSLLSRLLR